jgi:hypothetical protein
LGICERAKAGVGQIENGAVAVWALIGQRAATLCLKLLFYIGPYERFLKEQQGNPSSSFTF